MAAMSGAWLRRKAPRYLIRDRDRVYGAAVKGTAAPRPGTSRRIVEVASMRWFYRPTLKRREGSRQPPDRHGSYRGSSNRAAPVGRLSKTAGRVGQRMVKRFFRPPWRDD